MLVRGTFEKTAFLLVSLIIGSQNAGIINLCIMLKIIPAYIIASPLTAIQ